MSFEGPLGLKNIQKDADLPREGSILGRIPETAEDKAKQEALLAKFNTMSAAGSEVLSADERAGIEAVKQQKMKEEQQKKDDMEAAALAERLKQVDRETLN